jgi:hypothetical protein
MGKGSRKSRYHPGPCNYQIADGCKGFVNTKTAREENMCHACWQKKHAKRLNQRHNFWSFEGSKKKMMRIPIRLWHKVRW